MVLQLPYSPRSVRLATSSSPWRFVPQLRLWGGRLGDLNYGAVRSWWVLRVGSTSYSVGLGEGSEDFLSWRWMNYIYIFGFYTFKNVEKCYFRCWKRLQFSFIRVLRLMIIMNNIEMLLVRLKEHSSNGTWWWWRLCSSAYNSLSFQARHLILVLKDRGQLSYL